MLSQGDIPEAHAREHTHSEWHSLLGRITPQLHPIQVMACQVNPFCQFDTKNVSPSVPSSPSLLPLPRSGQQHLSPGPQHHLPIGFSASRLTLSNPFSTWASRGIFLEQKFNYVIFLLESNIWITINYKIKSENTVHYSPWFSLILQAPLLCCTHCTLGSGHL